MVSGYLLLAILIIIFLVTSAIFVFCYWYGDNTGHYCGFSTKEDSLNGTGNGKESKKKCSCSKSFKGLCKECKPPEFVNDGELGKMPDFRDYGGNLGLDGLGIGATAKVDPNRGFTGKTTNPWNGPAHGTVKHHHYV